MIELFTDISDDTKKQVEYWVNLALKQSNAFEAVKILSNLHDVQGNDNDKDFVNFYINMRLQQLINE